jgi:hypothetical protein
LSLIALINVYNRVNVITRQPAGITSRASSGAEHRG